MSSENSEFTSQVQVHIPYDLLHYPGIHQQLGLPGQSDQWDWLYTSYNMLTSLVNCCYIIPARWAAAWWNRFWRMEELWNERKQIHVSNKTAVSVYCKIAGPSPTIDELNHFKFVNKSHWKYEIVELDIWQSLIICLMICKSFSSFHL